jgi:hypothetical protein
LGSLGSNRARGRRTAASSRAATRLNNDADTNASQGPRNGKSRKPLLHCTRAACHARAHGSRGRERSSKPIQAFATKWPAFASGVSEGETGSRARRLGVESTLAANRRAPFHPPPAWWRSGSGRRPPAAVCRTGPRGHPAARHRGSVSERQPCPPVVRYESIRRGTLRILRRYCSDRTEPVRRSLKFAPYPAKLLAMQRAAP